MNYSKFLRFPLHCIPYIDELLSSFIYRLSEQNRISTFFIMQHIGNTYAGLSVRVRYNINMISGFNYLKQLCNLTGFDTEIFKRMTMHNYKKIFLVEGHKNSAWQTSNNFWFNAIRIRICPFCLKEAMYYRIHWKLQPVYACLKHKVLLLDKCTFCGQPIRDISPDTRIVYPLGKCWNCGAEFAKMKAISLNNDKQGLWIQGKIIHLLELSGKVALNKNLSLFTVDFFIALKILYRLISKLKSDNPILHRTGPANYILKEISYFFNLSDFNTKKGFPATKIPDIRFNYIVFATSVKILMNFPANFFRLLDELYKIQSPMECKTRNRVFGLLQKTHLLLCQEFPRFMQEAYKIWIKRRFKSLPYFKNKNFCTDAHLYPYSNMSTIVKIDPETIPLFLDEERWNKIKGFFYFPSQEVGSGNFYTRAVKRAKIFSSAYLYKLATGCSWSEVPAVKKGLIKMGGFCQRLWLLRKQRRLNKITKALLKILSKK